MYIKKKKLSRPPWTRRCSCYTIILVIKQWFQSWISPNVTRKQHNMTVHWCIVFQYKDKWKKKLSRAPWTRRCSVYRWYRPRVRRLVPPTDGWWGARPLSVRRWTCPPGGTSGARGRGLGEKVNIKYLNLKRKFKYLNLKR